MVRPSLSTKITGTQGVDCAQPTQPSSINITQCKETRYNTGTLGTGGVGYVYLIILKLLRHISLLTMSAYKRCVRGRLQDDIDYKIALKVKKKNKK